MLLAHAQALSLKAIRLGHFQSWPGIDSVNFKNIIENLVPTAKGHLDQERKNLQSTQQLEIFFSHNRNQIRRMSTQLL